MDSLFPDREWWWSAFLESDKGGGGGGGDDSDDDADDESDDDSDDESADDKLANALEALRKERADHRKTRRSLSTLKKSGSGEGTGAKPKGGESNKDSDGLLARLEAQQETIDSLRLETRTNKAESAVVKSAAKAGAANPERIYKLVRTDIDFDDDGKPENIDDLIADAKKEFPELFKPKGGKGDLGNGSRSDKSSKKGGDWIRALVDNE